MLNTGYMEFFNGENIPESDDLRFIKSFFTDGEEVLFFFAGLRDRLAFFTTKRLVFIYAPDETSRQIDFVHYSSITSYAVISSAEYENAKLEITLPDICTIGLNFSSIDRLMKCFSFLSKVI